jgi:ABC-type nitrate/sulfonate/bicarbonate transport system substrate-binding protein
MINPVRSALPLCAMALACVPIMVNAFAQDAGVATVRVGTAYPGPEEMPVFLARDNGYFRDEHLSVSLTYLSTGDKIAYALLSGSIDIARYTPDWFIRAVMKGGSNVKIVLGSSNVLTFSLIVPKSVNGYADLKGKRIGVSTIAAADTSVVIKMLAAHGLKRGDYSLIQAGSSPERAAALHAGSLGATLLSPPADQRLIDDGGFKRLDFSTNVIPHYAWGAETISEDWAKANKPKLVAYMRAWIKAFRFLHDPNNKEAVIKLLAREGKIDDHYAHTTYDIYYGPKATAPAKDGKLEPLDYQVMIADMVERGQIDPPPPSPDKFLDTSYWDEAERTLR